MKRYTITAIALLAGCIAASAQVNNLNQTVQVTNTYEGNASVADKSTPKVFVPDSLYHFDLNFDYSGFDSPYRGVNGYNPFYTELEMAPRATDARRLYLKAGAGYTLSPVLDAAFTIKPDGKFKIGAYATHNSYIGNYWHIVPPVDEDVLRPDGSSTKGYDFFTDAGLSGRYDWEKVSLTMKVGYEGVQAKNDPCGLGYTAAAHAYNGVNAVVSVGSNLNASTSPWRYGATLGYSFGYDRIPSVESPVPPTNTSAYENGFRFSGNGGYVFGGTHHISLEAGFDAATGMRKYNMDDYFGYVVTVNPKYHFTGLKVRLAVGLGMMVSGGRDGDSRKSLSERGMVDNRSSLTFFPTLDFNWTAVQDKLDVYAHADLDGSFFGARAKSLKYHFYIQEEKLSITKTFNVDAGIRGNLFGALYYNLRGGFERNDMMPVVTVAPQSGCFSPKIVHENLNDFFVGLNLAARFYGFTLVGDVRYTAWLQQQYYEAAPPALTVSLDLKYALMDRVDVYAGASYTSKARAGVYTVPGSVDLHVGGRFFFTDKVGVFLEGKNLLSSAIQAIPLIAPRGICVTGGIVLNL